MNKHEKTIQEFTNKFSNSIPETEDKREQLIAEFKRYLEDTVKTSKDDSFKYACKDPKSIYNLLKDITDEYCSKDIITMKRELLNDESMLKIQQISESIFNLAIKKLKGETINIKPKRDEIVKKMLDLEKGVEEYNIDLAKNEISECIVDMTFLEQDNPTVYSMRINGIKNIMKKSTKKEER